MSTLRGADLAERLSRLPLTYAEVGGTASAQLPTGYRHVERSLILGTGTAVFERARAGLTSWELHRRAGLGVDGNAPTAVTGSCVLLIIGSRPLALTAPCRVVHTVDETSTYSAGTYSAGTHSAGPVARAGFAYGTLPGHPESGEESFIVALGADDRVTFTVRAFSTPATIAARLGGPLTHFIQDAATTRYLRTLQRIAGPDQN